MSRPAYVERRTKSAPRQLAAGRSLCMGEKVPWHLDDRSVGLLSWGHEVMTMLDEKDLQALDQLMAHRMGVLIESDILPKFDLLAEGQAGILDRLDKVTAPEKAN